ncbi:MAG: crotonobetainyl-CoA--carnitine CoA-transferase [Bacteroidia bacterium]|nr:crotonobetainyl-CoA--carnitine CoA-transferase [Bacteroidia bacterium]
MKNIKVLSGANEKEKNLREDYLKLYSEAPIADSEKIQNMGLFINRMNLSRILFMQELYLKIINVHGIIIEFGVRWGQNLSLFSNFRGIYEPFNYNRKIVGFDTFEGFPEVDLKDGEKVSVGDYNVTNNYEDYLEKVLIYHESESPISHKRKFELVKGDATKTFEKYLISHPETIVAFAYFDFDIYKPTKICLELLMERVTKGSVIAFDELNCPEFPGETLALMEVMGLKKYSIRRSPLTPLISYLTIE